MSMMIVLYIHDMVILYNDVDIVQWISTYQMGYPT